MNSSAPTSKRPTMKLSTKGFSSKVAVDADVVGGKCDRHCKIGSFCGQVVFEEDPQVHLESWTVVLARTPSTDALRER